MHTFLLVGGLVPLWPSTFPFTEFGWKEWPPHNCGPRWSATRSACPFGCRVQRKIGLGRAEGRVRMEAEMSYLWALFFLGLGRSRDLELQGHALPGAHHIDARLFGGVGGDAGKFFRAIL